jgi:hypothetical protein
MQNGLFLSSTTLSALPASVRDAVVAAVLGDVGPVPSADEREVFDAEYDALAVLYPPKMREFMTGVGDTSKLLLREIAEGRADWRHLMDTANHDKWQQLSGFLSGLTKRVRSVTGDVNATFWGIRKTGAKATDANGEFDNDTLLIHPVTLKSLRRYFGMD